MFVIDLIEEGIRAGGVFFSRNIMDFVDFSLMGELNPTVETSVSWRLKYMIIGSCVSFLCSFMPAMAFVVLGDWGKWDYLQKYAIRSGKKRLPSSEQQWQAIKTGLKDLFLKPLLFWFGWPYLGEPLLLLGTERLNGMDFLGDLLKMEVFFSVSFYLTHRVLHEVNFLYVNIHKIHHQFHESVGFAGQYAHLIEEASSAFHVSMAAYLVRPNMVTWMTFFGLVVFEVVDAHSGYSVPWRFLYPWSDVYPWGSGARSHDYHHSHNKGAYGGGLIGLDRLFGSDKMFNKFEAARKAKAVKAA
jgi:sterol desaturase/sphingolipid hydroxylase (fatty acid hydroxylase superfamily)